MEQDERLYQALSVFLQYGFKKTSMDDVASALGISRQALYKQYGNKQQLFDAVITNIHMHSMHLAEAAITCGTTPLISRLVNAVDLMGGRFIEELHASPHSTEVFLIAENGDVAEQCQSDFKDMLEGALRQEKSLNKNLKPRDVVEVVFFVTKGLMHGVRTRKEFVEGAQKAFTMMLT